MQQQRIGPPYGDIFIVGTPHLDQLSQQLYAEQKQREAMRQRDAQALDNEFSKNVANIRDADVDDVTQKYGQWKAANQQLLKKRGGATPQEQLALLRMKADVTKIINASKSAKQEEEDWAKTLVSKPDDFDDYAYKALSTRRSLPMSQFGEINFKGDDGQDKVFNLKDLNSLRYKGTDTDFSKIEREAIGLPKTTFTEPLRPDATDPFTLTGKTFTYANTPEQFYQNYLGALAQRKVGRDAEALSSQIPQETYSVVQEKFKNIPIETWQRMGVDKPQELFITPEDGKAQILAKHKAQLYALNNQPKEGAPIFRRNEKAHFDAQMAKEKEMEAARQRNRERNLALGQSYRKALVDYKGAKTADQQDGVINRFIKQQYDNGTDTFEVGGQKFDGVTIDGKTYKGKMINVPRTIQEKYRIDKGFTSEQVPDTWILTDDFKQIVPIYVDKKAKRKSGAYNVKPAGKPVDVLSYKTDLRPLLLTLKDGDEAILEEFDIDEEDTPAAPPSSTNQKQRVYKGVDKKGNPIFE